MQKKLIALAIAGLASSAAFAQSNVTVYGLVDYGFVSRNGNDGGVGDSNRATSPQINGTRHELASGVQAGSRIGFRGAEDLGNGVKAIFELEYGITVDNGGAAPVSSTTSPFWNRHSYVGLTGGFGTVVGGRVDGDRYSVINKYDPFGGGTVANAVTVFNEQVTRGDNAIAYITPDFSGFNALFAYTTSLVGNESTGTCTATTPITCTDQHNGDIRLWLSQFNYNNGPIAVTLNFESADRKNISNSDIRIVQVGGSYDFGVVKVSALWDSLKDDIGGGAAYSTLAGTQPKNDVRNWLVGGTVPIGNGLVRAQYSRHQDKTFDSSDCRKFGIGYRYNLSKRTNVYTDYARITNDGNATCQIGFSGTAGAADFAQTSRSSLYGVHGFDFGIQHAF
jgi:predicted porin